MRNEEVKDYTLLAYFLIHKYCGWAKNKEDLKEDLLVEALKAEPTYVANPWTSKTSYLTQCMKNYLFGVIRKAKSKTRGYNSYYLDNKTCSIEDIKEPVLEDVYKKSHLNKIDAIEIFERILDSSPHSRTIELTLETAHQLELSPAKVFECVLDNKMEDMYVHPIEYSLCLDCKPRRVITSSFILHNRFLAKDAELRTLQEVGDILQLTRERVRQLEDSSLQFVRKRLEDIFAIDFRREDDICDWRYPWDAVYQGTAEDSGCLGAPAD